ncbi:MAG TPA: bacteriocin immunity protein [Polyangiaceae bacterium]
MNKLNRNELIALVQKILDIAGTEDEIAAWLTEFEANVPHPLASDLIFWNDREPLTAESIVDEALAYRSPEKQ